MYEEPIFILFSLICISVCVAHSLNQEKETLALHSHKTIMSVNAFDLIKQSQTDFGFDIGKILYPCSTQGHLQHDKNKEI